MEYARNDATEWKQTGASKLTQGGLNGKGESSRRESHWTRPPQDWLKCNTYGSFMNIGVQSTVGWIIRDENGVYKGAAQATGKRVMNPLESELQGILMAVQHCWALGFRKIILENDCIQAIDILNGKTLHFSFYDWIREIKWWIMRFDEV
ncbi:PREDICTED: uncharacterized protein LOC106331224 [Brassica oleracea var. oleracea]|uniref:uncharacterized protein LOC106331224 n=1 Tax=Brassica oleracea var. oleracea TaxID=109376 RepID=UPI0006A6C23E|nr:PREDICTED: uncharacterized protein LOC106331224 [Brassica oleracea var. oleracea]